MDPFRDAAHPDAVYMLYVPGTTTVDASDVQLGTLCSASGYVGYHNDAPDAGGFIYAVMADCTGNSADVTVTVAHELLEASTDAHGNGWYLDLPGSSAWNAWDYSELGDLCDDVTTITENGVALQRTWSNAEAALGHDPCVPAPAGEIYVNVSAAPDAVVTLSPGQQTTFTLTGWSTAATGPWSLSVSPGYSNDFDPTGTLSTTSIDNGQTASLTVAVPSGVASGKCGSLLIYSGSDGQSWPVTVVTPLIVTRRNAPDRAAGGSRSAWAAPSRRLS